MFSNKAPWENNENDGFVRKIRCIKSLQEPFLNAANSISVIIITIIIVMCLFGLLLRCVGCADQIMRQTEVWKRNNKPKKY